MTDLSVYRLTVCYGIGGDLTMVACVYMCLREPVFIHHLYLFSSLRYFTTSCNNIAFHELSINYCVPDANINPKGMGVVV